MKNPALGLIVYCRYLLSLVSLISLSCFSISCADEETENPLPPDTEKPIITLVSPSDVTLPLRATVTVRAEASDNAGIAVVKILVDDAVLTEVTSSPAEISWDTKTVSDGDHQIKIIATDTEGNSEEVSLTVEVRNVLFTFDIVSGFVPDGIEMWIFTNDDDGTAIEGQQIANGMQFTFETPEGFSNDKQYTFSQASFETFDLEGFVVSGFSILSYSDLKPGSYVIGENQVAPPPIVGQHVLVVTPGAEPSYSSKIVLSREATSGVASGPFSMDAYPMAADLYTTPARVVYMQYNFNGNFDELIPIKYIVPNAASGQITEVSQSEFTNFNSFIVPMPGSTISSFSINVVQRAGDYQNLSFFLNKTQFSNAEELEVYDPEVEPYEYITVLSGDPGFYRLTSPDLPTTYKTLNATLSNMVDNETSVSFDLTGDFDYLRITGNYDFETETAARGISWLYYADKSSVGTVQKPQLPAELLSVHPDFADAVVSFQSLTALRSTGVTDYWDWVGKRNNGTSILNVSKEEYRKSMFLEPSPGRTRSKKFKPGRYWDLDDKLMDMNRP